ncbi:MAG: Spore germination protein B1 [Firmicutes bacterium]|nr:Spore germination protein B1 [candidate division NPL-UPA2 bacterium]
MAGWWEKINAWLTRDTAKGESVSEVPLQGYTHDLDYFRGFFMHAPDFTAREFRLGLDGKKMAVLYLRSLADEARIAAEVILPLSSIPALVENAPHTFYVHTIRNLMTCGTVAEVDDLTQALDRLLLGETILLADGLRVAMVVDARASRGITPPEIETTVFGPKLAFVEDCETNLSLVRQQIRTPALHIETFTLGKRNPRRVFMLYIDGLATEETVNHLRMKLQSINVGSLLHTNCLQSLLGISPLSPFPQAIHSERPDRVSGNLLEGRIALFLDGSPEAIILPMGFSDLFQSPADYYDHYAVTTLTRTFRLLAFLIATTLPALYVAIITYNYELLPTDLIFAVATARAGIPFPPVIESVLMVLLVDILQEGALRIPSKIGQTVGVVGGFMLGQAVILARLVSPLLVIVVAISVISSFGAPDYRVVGLTRLLRYVMLAAAGVLSGIGIAAAWTAILIHMASLEILGVAYLRPFAPLRLSSLSDFVFRKPYQGATASQTKRVQRE